MLKSPFKSRDHKDFKILIFYPNLHMSALMPQSVGIFTALLKQEGYPLDLFDCTYYEDIDSLTLGKNTNEEKVENRNVHKYDNTEWHEKGVKPKNGIVEAFKKKVITFKPDLILVSVLESTYYLAIDLLKAIPEKDRTYKTFFGGVFATYAANKIIKNDLVDYVCRGEGEGAVVEMANALSSGGRIDQIKNCTVKGEGNIFKNNMRPPIDIDSVPIPDWDLFESGSLYRPMQGKIWRAVGFETQRGCPYTCTFCNSPSNNVEYKAETGGKFHRKKSIGRMKKELDFLVKKYDPNLIYFVVDTFLAMSNREFDELKELYSDYKIPFWMNTRAETINEYRAAGLAEMNMLRMNIGIEHGNYDYRRNYLKRNVKNEVQIRAFQIAAEHDYASCANSIIGMPDETRDLIFDTINFVRELPDSIDATGAFIFAPYHGTPLRDLAIRKGYIDDEEICSLSNTSESMLRMPTITKNEIQGLAKTFSLYTKFPKERWPEIKIAESDSVEGAKMMDKLGKEFDSTYRQFAAGTDLHD
ncbi:B12-binding domain-containing radical SAM protein [Candidatus Pelagibacter sp.]|jgi:anaerobic magnesium-protoporphyrin IX monomethyl ester cyclase|nr:B12-binding domain-containing radical SAM protein [Candidatus Pelagibacter sp.]